MFRVYTSDETLTALGAYPCYVGGPAWNYTYISPGVYDTSIADMSVVNDRISDIASDNIPLVLNIEEFYLYDTSVEVTAASSSGLQLSYDSTAFTNYTQVRFTTTGTLPAGLSEDTDYWLIKQSSTTAKVSTSREGAVLSQAIAYMDAGTGTHTMTSQRSNAITNINAITDAWVADGKRMLGHYGIIPDQEGHYWTCASYISPGGGAYVTAYEAWQAQNDANYTDLHGDSLTMFCPSVYALYKPGDPSFGTWNNYVTGLLREAVRLANGRPVFPFVWPMYHPSATGGSTAIALDEWTSMVEHVATIPGVTGVFAWSEDADTPIANYESIYQQVNNRRESKYHKSVFLNAGRSRNVVRNYSFEDAGADAAEPLDLWTAYVSGSSTITRDTDEHETGAACCKISVDASNNAAYIRQAVLQVGRTYRIVVRAKIAGGAGSFKISAPGDIKVWTLSDHWETYTHTWVATNSYVRLARNNAASKTIYIDRVEIRQV